MLYGGLGAGRPSKNNKIGYNQARSEGILAACHEWHLQLQLHRSELLETLGEVCECVCARGRGVGVI